MKMDLLCSFLFISTFLLSQISAQDCQLRDNCECVYADGTGYNLKPVIDGDKSLEAITIQNLTFFYHPCGNTQSIPNLPNINDTDNACKVGYSLCMYDTAHNKTILLGQSGDMKFRRQHGDSMQVLFTKTSDNIVSSITLECTPKAKTSVLYAPLEKIDQVNLSLFSPFACPVQVEEIHHRGFFSTLFIVLFTLLFVYLFIGILINYFFIGARGYELIPNYDFWCKVWRSMKLGFIYVKNGCRVIPVDDSYDAI